MGNIRDDDDAAYAMMPFPQEHNHRHTHHVTTHEYRAPTDDSIRLAKEMEEKVRAKIVANFDFPENKVLHANVIKSVEMFGNVYFVVFQINGQAIKIYVDMPPMVKGDAAVKHLVETVAKELTVIIISQLVPDASIMRVFEG